MKKSIVSMASALLLVGAFSMGCNSSTEKLKDAKEDVVEADAELEKAKAEYLEDMKTYRAEAAERILENEKSIAEFKARVAKDKKEAKSEYNEKIADLEAKNTDMKKQLDNYQDDGFEKWKSFKTEFGKDMDSLGNAFKNLTIKNN
jgi:septal ring factor EnvC (AmiA/AmiB activator)